MNTILEPLITKKIDIRFNIPKLNHQIVIENNGQVDMSVNITIYIVSGVVIHILGIQQNEQKQHQKDKLRKGCNTEKLIEDIPEHGQKNENSPID